MNRLRQSLICLILNFFIENHSKQLKSELIRIYLKKCVQRYLKKYICMYVCTIFVTVEFRIHLPAINTTARRSKCP